MADSKLWDEGIGHGGATGIFRRGRAANSIVGGGRSCLATLYCSHGPRPRPIALFSIKSVIKNKAQFATDDFFGSGPISALARTACCSPAGRRRRRSGAKCRRHRDRPATVSSSTRVRLSSSALSPQRFSMRLAAPDVDLGYHAAKIAGLPSRNV
jgi:hypothetical protein